MSKMKNVRFFFAFFFNNSNISDFVNSGDCIGKITSNSIRLQPVLIQKKIEVDKK